MFNLRNAAIVGAAAGMALITGRSLDATDAIGKTADRVGLAVDELQELRFAAELSGASTATLDMAMQRFSRRVGEAAAGTGELKDTIDAYGVQLRDSDGRLRSNTDILADFADIIQSTTSEQERLRIAFKLFDSEGARLVNLLRHGSAGMSEMQQQARSLGIVMDEAMVRNSEAANDKLTALSSVLSAKLNIAVAENADAIGELAVSFMEAIPAISSFVVEVGRFWGVLDKDPHVKLMEIRQEIRKLDEAARSNVFGSLTDDVREFFGFDTSQEKRAELLREEVEILKEIDGIISDMSESGPDSASMPILFDESALEGAMAKQERIKELQKEAAKVIESTLTPQQKLNQETELYNELLSEGLLTQEQFSIAVSNANDELSEGVTKLDSSYSDLGNTISSAFEDAIIGGERLQDVMQGLAEDISRVILRSAIISPLEKSLAGFGSSIASNIGSSFGSSFGGFFADGGNPPVGKASIVGERGPELFVPNTAGTIIPNNQVTNMGGATIYQNINVSGAEVTQQDIIKLVPLISQKAKQSTLEALRQGGTASAIAGLKS